MSILLSSLILLSTTSFVVDEHYCGNMKVDSSIFGKASSCFCEASNKANNNNDTILENDNCCTNNVIVHESNDELKSNSAQLSSENTLFLHSYFYSYINLFEGLESNIIPFKNYAPPLIVTDLQVIHESFLI